MNFQKIILCVAVIFTIVSTLYALGMALIFGFSYNNWSLFALWLAIVLIFGLPLVKTINNAWRMTGSKDKI